MRLGALIAAAATAVAFALPAAASGAGDPRVAALQIGLHTRGLYAGSIDGMPGPRTAAAVRRLQRRARLTVDGVVGPRTRRALGRHGRPRLGSRVPALGQVGWDVAELQFRLAWHGFPSGRLDGAFGPRTRAALRRFQRWARLTADARAGPRTLAALRRPPASSPRSLGWPVSLPASDRFGPRGARFHAGIDFPGPAGAPVVAAAAGLVVYAQEHPLGYGLLVTIDHGDGLRTRYAHLSHASVTVGMRVAAGTQIGFVGSTGASTGPHLHFEVRWRGAAIDPLGALRR